MQDIINVIDQGTFQQRIDAIRKLGEMKNIESQNILRNALKNKDWHTRLEAAKALSKILGKVSLADLQPMLNDKAYGVRTDVQKIIESFED